ncbi:MAG TPA: MarR family transcriptional regulator [Candidatus Saccharimonadales bacterium]|nr:MarR family transcriptional regulator [Candidatus Saccharimonadales bacterium]
MPQNTSQDTSLERSYLIFFHFLMMSKHRVIELGKEYDLTAMQAMTLFLLEEHRAMHELKTIFNCDASNITGLVDGLEAKGLATRYEDPNDRRIKLIRLSKKGDKVRASLLSRAVRESQLLANLDEDEQRQLINLLAKATDGHDKMTPER